MEKTIKIAIIGSRETPMPVQGEMYRTMLWVLPILIAKGYKVILTSGGCWKGPDQLLFSFAHHGTYGNHAQVEFICYLPDGKKIPWMKEKHPNVQLIVPPDTPERRAHVRALHPVPDKLNDFMWLLHGRNCNIISGEDLQSNVDYVYYNAELRSDGLPKGGTYMGVAYAKRVGVKTITHGVNGEEVKWIEELKQLP